MCENRIPNVKDTLVNEDKCRRLKSVEKDVLFRFLDITILDDVDDISKITQQITTADEIDQDCGVYELIQETYANTSDKRPYDKTIDGYILMAYKTMEDMYSEKFANNWKLWSGVRHLCAKIPAPYHFEGMHFYKELTNICQFKYLLIIDVKKLLFYVATTLNVLQTVKPKLCAYVGVYKEIYKENSKKNDDGTCNNNNTCSAKNSNEKKLNDEMWNEDKIKERIGIKVVGKKLSDKNKLNWSSMTKLENKGDNCFKFQLKNETSNYDNGKSYNYLNDIKESINKNLTSSGNNDAKQNCHEIKKRFNIQSALPFSFLYRERLPITTNTAFSCYLENNKKNNLLYNHYQEDDFYKNNIFQNGNINLLKQNQRNYYLYDLEKLRNELLMDEEYSSPIYSRNEWLTYSNHEASIMEFQFSKLINLLK